MWAYEALLSLLHDERYDSVLMIERSTGLKKKSRLCMYSS